MERYIPHPKDTRNVTLPDEVLALAEQLARNTHEVWAAGPRPASPGAGG